MFTDEKGRTLFVTTGIGKDLWFTAWRKPTGSLKRFVAPSLPPRPSQEQAQADLEEYAAKRGWTRA